MRSKTRIVILVATHALLCGCGRLAAPDGGDADGRDRAGPSVRGTEIVRFDGFEGDSVASFWRPGNAGDGRYAPGAVAVSADYARTGIGPVLDRAKPERYNLRWLAHASGDQFTEGQHAMRGWAATAMIALSCVAGASRAAAQGTNANATSMPAAISITGERLSGLAHFDAAMVAFMREHRIPGASMAVVKSRRLVYARGFGLADVDRKEPVLPTSLFRIASVSKMFTGVAVLHLIEQGKLRGEDHVFDLLKLEKKVPEGATLDPRWREVTVYQLLHHEGGWDRSKSPDPGAISDQILRFNRAKPPLTTDHVVRYMLSRPLDFDPGRGFAYCNFGFHLLGTVIETVTGKSYEDFVREVMLKSIGITDMREGKTLLKDRAPREVRYYQQTEPSLLPSNMAANFGELVPSPYGAIPLEGGAAAGAWIGSTVDLARFITALDPRSEYKLLSPRARQQLFVRPQSPSGYVPNGPNGDYYSCGLWIRPKGSEGEIEAWHGGTLWGSSSSVLRRNDGVVAAVLFNVRDDNPKIDNLADAFLAEIHKCSNVAVWPPRGNLFPKFSVIPDHTRGPDSSRGSR